MSFLEKVIGADIEIRVLSQQDLRITLADPAQIDQVLMNLCLNARDAMPSGGKLIIETKNVDIGEEYCYAHAYARAGSYVLLSVSDTGVGMDAATQEHIFEPFFTTKEMGRGTGLGLATVYGIVKQHDGFIYVYSEPGMGTCFRVYLKAEAGAHESREGVATAPPMRGTETILLVEDHDGLRESGQEMLESLGYKVMLAKNGLEAVETFKDNLDRINLVIMDVVMPAMNGPDALTKMLAIRSQTEVIFTTGYTSEATTLLSWVQKGTTILQKPYSLASLSQTIRTSLDRSCSTQPAK
jgi:two-component system, cell cycle sensor histidine kinase and response regulator CckA